MTPQELEQQTARQVEALRQELADKVAAEQVGETCRFHFERLCLHATVNDFIPLFVYRFAKNDLLTGRAEDLHQAA